LEINASNIFQQLAEQSQKILSVIGKLNLPNYTFEETDRIFAKYGWYIPRFIEVRIVFDILKLFEEEKGEEANKILVKYFKQNLKEIQDDLIRLHPDRGNVIREAFLAHKKKLYFSSTILFLSQADGICDSIIFTESKLKKIKNKKESHHIVKVLSESNSLTSYYNPITKNSNFFSDLNRHGVMHGVSNDYGTELNSLKALSLLSCVDNFSRYQSK
jgi:hypothetical protein